MHRILPTLTLFAALLTTQSLWSQAVTVPQTAADTVDPQHVLDAFHEAVVTHNGSRLAALFLPEGSTWVNVLSDQAFLRTRAGKPDAPKVRLSNYKDFATFVSTTKQSLDPRHTHLVLHSDGTIASAYFDFDFFIDGKVQNRGSETWQMVKGEAGWRIAAISYSSDPQPAGPKVGQ